MSTPDVRPAGVLPNDLGKTAPRGLQSDGIDSLSRVSKRTEKEDLAIHGVGPTAIRILPRALAENAVRSGRAVSVALRPLEDGGEARSGVLTAARLVSKQDVSRETPWQGFGCRCRGLELMTSPLRARGRA